VATIRYTVQKLKESAKVEASPFDWKNGLISETNQTSTESINQNIQLKQPLCAYK
jgi:hypothetical protein